jgi:tetraacyldisaccharide 4'-kinase
VTRARLSDNGAPVRTPPAVNPAVEHYAQRVMSGAEPGARAALLRAGLSIAEPFSATTARVRNRLYDAGLLRTHRLPVPVVSVGNLTTGGTGKTPVVRWLAESLRSEGRRVAIISRGYRAAAPGQLGDEQLMLARQLNAPGRGPDVLIGAHPDRVAAAKAALRDNPGIDVVLLDDGFQHRRLARNFDLVLVSAANPFGYGRVLPRGLLREPLSGLRRASAVLLTHADQAGEAERMSIERVIRQHAGDVPIYHAVHAPAGFHREADGGGVRHGDLADLRGRRWFAFCGIGSPRTFLEPLERAGGEAVGRRVFGDHHAYSPDDWAVLVSEAKSAGADVLVTTEKDWVKVAPLYAAAAPDHRLPVWRADVAIRFREGDESALLDRIRAALGGGR